MSLVLQFSICQSNNCKKFTFTEQTKAYSTNNTSGWGSPNPATTDAVTATLAVTSPSNITTTFNLFTNSYPTTDFTQEYIILNTDLGYASTASIKDGEWTFVYTITTASATYTQTVRKFTWCQAKCCVFQMFKDVPDDVACDCCESDIQERAEKAKAFLDSLENAAECQQRNKFNRLLTTVNNLCGNQNCSSCT